jgi:peptide/nickel transport system permease protein
MTAQETIYNHIPNSALQRLRNRSIIMRRWSAFTLWTGVAIVLITILLTAAAPLLGFKNPNEGILLEALSPPSSAHLFGTDDVGRDILTRMLYGGWIDLSFGLITTYVSLVIGLMLGALSGYFGGILDAIVMRIVDLVISFPFIVLILAITAITGPGLYGAYVGVMA